MVNTSQQPHHIPRRDFLKGGVTTPLAIELARRSLLADMQGKSKDTMAVILLYLDGGADNKSLFAPDSDIAPIDFRGPFSSIQTSASGIRFSEMLPHTAKHADRMSVIRSIHTGSNNHPTSAENQLKGNKRDSVSWEWGSRTAEPGQLPYGFIRSPQDSPYKSAHSVDKALGFDWHDTSGSLDTDPYEDMYYDDEIKQIPYDALSGFYRTSISDLSGEERQRFTRRLSLLRNLSQSNVLTGEQIAAFERNRDLAISLYSGDGKISHAMHPNAQAMVNGKNIAGEPAYEKRLAGYGGKNFIAQSLLLSARLVEAGARFVTVNHSHFNTYSDSWDDHSETEKYVRMKAPPLDAAIAGLIADIRSGRMRDTLLVIATDFDRTPRMNKRGGRDHWNTGTLVMAAPEGHGIVGGSTYGKKTHDGEVTEDALSATNGDVVRTIMHAAADGRHDEFMVQNEQRARGIMQHR